MTQVAATRPVHQLQPSPAGSTPRILVVEDEQIVALDLQERLSDLGYLVPAVAGSGEKAIELAELHRPDLILMDVRLHGNLDGVETADRIQARFDIPVVFLTAFADDSTLQRARLTGPFGYLVKPFDIDSVRSTIEMALYRHQVDRTLKENARFLALLNDITRAALEETTLGEVVQVIVDRLGALYCADACDLYLWDEESHGAVPAAPGKGWPAACASHNPRPLDHFCQEVLEGGSPLFISDTAGETTTELASFEPNSAQSVLALPLISNERKLGVVLVLFSAPRNIPPAEIERGRQAALHIALALARTRLVEQLEEMVAARTIEIAAEKEIRETILRNVDHAIMMADGESIIRYINPAFATLTGYSEQDALGRPASSIGAGAGSESTVADIQASLHRGEGWRGEVTAQRKDGRTYDAALSLWPVLDANGIRIGLVSSHQDISPRRSLERARRQFMNNVSHELRTPITNILLYAHLLQTADNLPDRSTHHIRVLSQQAERLRNLVEDILKMTDLDSGRGAETWKPVPLLSVVREMVGGFSQQADEVGVTLTLHPIAPDLPAVMGDQVRLGQALAQVIENALIFTPSGGRVEVGMTSVNGESGSWVAVSVRDTGPGIPPDEVELIFERFYRGRLAEAGDLPGTGLGLSIAQEIVRAHGGRITVDSTVGLGSVFTLWLPGSGSEPSRRNP